MRYVWIMFGAVATSALPAAASPVTWEFAGEIYGVDDDGDLLGEAVAAGSPFSVSYTFESTTPGSGDYIDAISDVSGYVGSVAFRGPVGSANRISVSDDVFGEFDHYGVRVEVELLGERSILSMGLRDATGTMFSSSDLPTTPPALDGLDPRFTGFSMGTIEELFYIGGDITSLVPDPGTLALMGIATLLVSRRRRREITFRG